MVCHIDNIFLNMCIIYLFIIRSSKISDNLTRAWSRSPLGGRYMTPMVIGVSPLVNCTKSDSRFSVTLDAGSSVAWNFARTLITVKDTYTSISTFKEKLKKDLLCKQALGYGSNCQLD